MRSSPTKYAWIAACLLLTIVMSLATAPSVVCRPIYRSTELMRASPLQSERNPHAHGNLRDSLRPIFFNIRRDDLCASEVIRRPRTLLVDNEIEHKPTDLNAVVADVCALLRRRSGASGSEGWNSPRLGSPIVGDRTQIQQVLINQHEWNGHGRKRKWDQERRSLVLSSNRIAVSWKLGVGRARDVTFAPASPL